MSKRTHILISIFFVFGLVGSAAAYDEIYWDDGDPCDHLWSSPENWDPCGYPSSTDPCTDDGDIVHVESGFGLGNSPIIDDGVIEGDPNTGSFVLAVIVGAWEPGDAYLTMTGGYLRIDDGWDAFMLGLCESIPCSGTLNMSGGLIDVYGADLFVGDKGIGYLNMTDPCDTGGGIIDTNGGQLALPGTSAWFKDSGTGEGHIDLQAGTIICGSIFMQAPSTIDINEGTLIIEGDASVVVTGYVESGWITGRGSGDPRNVSVVYDDVNDITILTYDPSPDVTLPWRPRPLPGSTDINWLLTLSWNEGIYADTHSVYFGSSISDVNESATPVSPNQPGTTYDITSHLEFGATYYWRSDEVNDACAPYVWQGPVWNFTVGDSVRVVDFDSYPDHPDLKAVWHDWSTGGYRADVYVAKGALDANLVRDGNSMEYNYDNDVGGGGTKNRYSEAWANTADLELGSNWAASDARALVLYFYGQAGNAADPVKDRMWVVLSDDTNEGMVKYAGDMNDIKKEQWQEWNIDLQDPCLSAVDNNNITKVYIGFGVRAGTGSGQDGGTGTVYFDDIRVHPVRCVDAYGPDGDTTGDCTVDYMDVNAVTTDWLLSDYNIVATAPAAPVGWWKLDEGTGATIAYDSAGTNNGTYDGPFGGPPDWVDDPCHGNVPDFDGVSYVDIPGAAFTDVNDELTITLWQYGTMTPAEVAHVMLQARDACDPYDLTVKCELWQPSATGCEVYFDAGLGGEDGADSVTGLASPSDYQGQWNHYAYTKKASTGEMRIYLNGVLFADEGEDTLTSPVKGSDISSFKLASDANDSGTRRYDGYLSDVRLYNKTLSYGEVRYVAGQMDDLPIPLPRPEVDLYLDGDVNLKDYGVLADDWLVEILWP